MTFRELFEGIINNKIPSLDIIDSVEKLAGKKGGVTKKFLDQLLSDFSFYLQEYVDLILQENDSNSELIKEYQKNRKDNNEWVIFYLIQEYYSDAGLSEWQKDSIMRFCSIIYNSIEHAEYLMSDKVTMRDSIGDSYKEGLSNSFFAEVHETNLPDFEIYKRVEELTDGFDPIKIKLLCKDFDFFFWWERELWEGKFSEEEIQNKVVEYQKAGKKLPMMGMGDQGGKGVSDFFKPERKIKSKPLTKEKEKELDKTMKEMHESLINTINVRKLMDPHGIEFYSLYRLRNLLVQLKAEYTSAELRPEFKSRFNKSNSIQEGDSNKIKPIHWNKGEESLREFLQSIKKEGLIENRETDDIIQEHIFVDGKIPTKEPQSIKWLNDNKYLAYMMHRLAEEFIINIKGRKHELTASHFISSDDKPLNTNSLASQLSYLINHGKSTDKNISSIENIIQRIKS